jgi:hypothetical protein
LSVFFHGFSMKSILLALGLLIPIQGFSNDKIEEETNTSQNVQDSKEIPSFISQFGLISGLVTFYLLGFHAKRNVIEVKFNQDDLDPEEENREEVIEHPLSQEEKILMEIQNEKEIKAIIFEEPLYFFSLIRKLIAQDLNTSILAIEIMDYMDTYTDRQFQETYQYALYESDILEPLPEVQPQQSKYREALIISALFRILDSSEGLFKQYMDKIIRNESIDSLERSYKLDHNISDLQELKTPLRRHLKSHLGSKSLKDIIDQNLTPKQRIDLIQKSFKIMPPEEQVAFMTRASGLFIFLMNYLHPDALFLECLTEEFISNNQDHWMRKIMGEIRSVNKKK